MWMFWFVRGHLTEGRRWIEAMLHAPGADRSAEARARALFTAGILAFYQRDHDGGQRFHQEALNLQRQLGDRDGIADALFGLAQNAFSLGDLRAACDLHEQALAIRRALGDQWKVALSLGNLGLVVQELDQLARARQLIEECLSVRRAIGDRRGTGAALVLLGRLLQACGEHSRAQLLYRDALVIVRELDDQWTLTHLLAALAVLMSALGQWELVCRLGDAAALASQTSGNALFPGWLEPMDRAVARARLELGSAPEAGTSAESSGNSVDALVAAALAVDARDQRAADQLGIHPTVAIPLSRREREVAVLVARGCSNPEIAAALTITVRTAAAHVEHILRKLKMNSRTQVGRWALANLPESTVQSGTVGELATF